MEEVSVLIGRSQSGDKEAREVLIEKNLGLVHHIVKRFLGRGYDPEDLFQIGVPVRDFFRSVLLLLLYLRSVIFR